MQIRNFNKPFEPRHAGTLDGESEELTAVMLESIGSSRFVSSWILRDSKYSEGAEDESPDSTTSSSSSSPQARLGTGVITIGGAELESAVVAAAAADRLVVESGAA